MKMLENDPACVICITEVFQLHKFIENILKYSCNICNLQFGGPVTTDHVHVKLNFSTMLLCYSRVGLAPARSVLYSKFQCVHVNLSLLPLLMR